MRIIKSNRKNKQLKNHKDKLRNFFGTYTYQQKHQLLHSQDHSDLFVPTKKRKTKSLLWIDIMYFYADQLADHRGKENVIE